MAKKLLKKQSRKQTSLSKRAKNSKKASTRKPKVKQSKKTVKTKKTPKKITASKTTKKTAQSASVKVKKSRKTRTGTAASSSTTSKKSKSINKKPRASRVRTFINPPKEKKEKRVPKPRKKSIVEKKIEVTIDNAPKPIEKAAATAVAKNQYFTKTHEEAIIRYATSTDRHEKSVLYITLIQPAFNEMVDKIVFTYKFTSLPNIEDLKDECKIWLTTILDKFDVSKGSKAFSYFSVITKNWFIHKVKKNTNGKEVGLEDISQEFEEDNLFVTNGYEEEREKNEFWGALWQEMDAWSRGLKKPNEKIVYDSIRYLAANKEEIEIFNKKAIYLYIREMTGLSTKQIVSSLNKFKTVYMRFVRNWNTGEQRQAAKNVENEKHGEAT